MTSLQCMHAGLGSTAVKQPRAVVHRAIFARPGAVLRASHLNVLHKPSPLCRSTIVRAEKDEGANKPETQTVKAANSVGMPANEGFFGFKPFAEMFVGRLAMLGFVSSVVVEYKSGLGTLQQIGLLTPNPSLFWFLVIFFSTATLVGTVNTGKRLVKKEMTGGDVKRYKNFLGLKDEEVYDKTASAMKQQGDFTTLTNDQVAATAARREGTPADAVLDLNDRAQAADSERESKRDGNILTLTKDEETRQIADTERQMKRDKAAGPSLSLAAREDIEEQLLFKDDRKYARNVELNNGRAAMLGFLSAILVEAATGRGIIAQVILYLKLVNLLGPDSGF